MKIYPEVEDRLSIFNREYRRYKETTLNFYRMKIIMSVLSSRLYTSEILISELKMFKVLSK